MLIYLNYSKHLQHCSINTTIVAVCTMTLSKAIWIVQTWNINEKTESDCWLSRAQVYLFKALKYYLYKLFLDKNVKSFLKNRKLLRSS